jgi:hypothetical protein
MGRRSAGWGVMSTTSMEGSSTTVRQSSVTRASGANSRARASAFARVRPAMAATSHRAVR